MQRHIAEHIEARARAQSGDTREAQKKSGILRLRAIYHCGKRGACVTRNHQEPPLELARSLRNRPRRKKYETLSPRETFQIVMVSSRVQFKHTKFGPSIINVSDPSASPLSAIRQWEVWQRSNWAGQYLRLAKSIELPPSRSKLSYFLAARWV